ncbi:MAG: heavy-metal-associated domain-containing protein [Anaerolineae bacterium]|nr:heavy-metal-associated domain-containing protein [Anaerolineae bacterium]
MESKTFSVPNISCDHCVMTIKRELSALDGVTSVEGNADAKTIAVAWDTPANEDGIKSLLAEINYPAA